MLGVENLGHLTKIDHIAFLLLPFAVIAMLWYPIMGAMSFTILWLIALIYDLLEEPRSPNEVKA